ncbi:MAG: A24 family peptidase [Planctomycetota bacterium]
MFTSAASAATEPWIVWWVSIVLVVAAYIDGKILKVPNKITYPFIISGWIYWTIAGGFGTDGLLFSLAGTFVGMMLLLVLRNVGGMGAGDVKLLAGIGAWLGTVVTLYAFSATAIVGGVMAVWMIYRSGEARKHYEQGKMILNEWKDVHNMEKLSDIARERKPNMYLLPYGIPMAIGSLMYFGLAGMYF